MADYRYFKVLFKPDYDYEDMSFLTYMEIDEGNWVIRVIEEFCDGHRDIADEHFSTGIADLGPEPVPDLAEIAKDKELEPEWISKAEFETIWNDSLKSLGR